MGGIIPFVLQLLDALPGLIGASEQAAATINEHNAALKAMVAANRSPTQDEWNALNSQIAGLQAQLDAPVTPAAPVETPAPVAPAPADPMAAPLP